MISVVIPNYNGLPILEKNLPKLMVMLKASKLDFELIIVDDASVDDSRSVLEAFARPGLAKVIYRRQNGGFPVAVHQGFLEAKGEVVFVIKNDSIPERSDYFKLMLGHFKDPKTFAVSSALRTNENGIEETRGQGRIVFFRGMFLHFRRHDEYLKWLETSRSGRKQLEKEDLTEKSEMKEISAWADGGSSAYNREIYFKIGGFDPVYRPGYWEDTDLGYRAWKAGYKVDFEPKAILLHDFEEGVYKKKYGEEKIEIINMRNQIIFTLKNADFQTLTLHFKFLIFNLKIKNFLNAYWMAMERLPEILKGRKRQRKMYRLGDGEVLKKFK